MCVCVCGGSVHGARPTARPAVPRRRARANGGASALLPAATASCARNSQGRRATVRVGARARRGAGEGSARRAAHMSRAPPPEAHGVAARGELAATPRARGFAPVYAQLRRCMLSPAAAGPGGAPTVACKCVRPVFFVTRALKQIGQSGLFGPIFPILTACRSTIAETDRANWLVRPYLPNPDCMQSADRQPPPCSQHGVFSQSELVSGEVSTTVQQ